MISPANLSAEFQTLLSGIKPATLQQYLCPLSTLINPRQGITSGMPWLWICLVLSVLGPAICWRLGARARWMILGVVSWGLGVLVKGLVTYLLDGAGEAHWPIAMRGVIAGTNSATCELGAAAVFLRNPSVRLIDAIGFGVAIGSFEIVFTMGLGVLGGLDENLRFTAPPFAFVDGLFVSERFLTLLGHTGSRLLLFVALSCKLWLPGIIAFVTFSSIDGLASHGLAAKWNWGDTMVNVRFQMVVASLTLIEGGAAVLFVRKCYSKLTGVTTRHEMENRHKGNVPTIDGTN
jgi:hypothetical protein